LNNKICAKSEGNYHNRTDPPDIYEPLYGVRKSSKYAEYTERAAVGRLSRSLANHFIVVELSIITMGSQDEIKRGLGGKSDFDEVQVIGVI
jgi:hypothetical protein